jgi:spore coat polysaccharide biosynthesis protein SpsF
MIVMTFIQARMSSSRFPGKVLAPIGGTPMIARVIGGISSIYPKDRIVLATSTETSDDPLSLYVESLGIKVFRGPLDDVFGRFRLCLQANPCDWFFRISADSPLLNCSILAMMDSLVVDSLDLITNVQKRTFPHGHSVELLNAEKFSQIDPTRLSADDCEHVTRFYYNHADEFRILNLENMDADYAKLNFVVDTLDDLHRVEAMEKTVKYDFTPQVRITHQ